MHLWSNCCLGLCVYSALCTWRRLASCGLVQEGLISSGQQYPVRHQVKTQHLSLIVWIQENNQMACFCKTRNVNGSLFILSFSPYLHDFFAYVLILIFLLKVLQELKTDNIKVCVCLCAWVGGCKVIFQNN